MSPIDDEDRSMRVSGQGECLAQLLFSDGCLRFCTNADWEFLALLQVCRRWNATIRASPCFWASIPSMTEGVVRRSVALSQSAPLDLFRISLQKYWPSLECFVSVVSSEISRVRVIWLEVQEFESDRWASGPIFSVLASAEAPQLRRLRLLSHNALCDLNTNGWISTAFPSLRFVELSTINMQPSCALFSITLTELILTDCRISWNSPAELVRLLARLPLLEAFLLMRTPLPSGLDHPYFSPPPELNYPLNTRLQAVGLEGSLRAIHRILELLSFPPGRKRIYLSYLHQPSGLGTVHEISRACEHFETLALSFPADFRFPSVFVNYDLEQNMIETCSRLPDIGYGWQKVTSNPYVQIMHSWPGASSGSMVEEILSLATRAYATFMRHNCRGSTMELWIEVIGWLVDDENAAFTADRCYAWIQEYLPKVTELHLTGEAALSFFPWLFSRSASSVFPQLGYLEFARISLLDHIDEADADPANLVFKYIWAFLHIPEVVKMKPTVMLGGATVFNEVVLVPSMRAEFARLLGPRLKVRQLIYSKETVEIEVWRPTGELNETLIVRSEGCTSTITSPRIMETADADGKAECQDLTRYFDRVLFAPRYPTSELPVVSVTSAR